MQMLRMRSHFKPETNNQQSNNLYKSNYYCKEISNIKVKTSI